MYTASENEGALRQGELVSGLIQARRRLDSIGPGQAPVVQLVTHPWAMVMSQDCDLDWDFRARQGEPRGTGTDEPSPAKEVPDTLLCMALEAERLRARPQINSRDWDRMKINKDERYQFLQRIAPGEDLLGEGVPELCIDFKRYFTIPTDELYLQLSSGARRRCRLNMPYGQHLATRFFLFQCRIALPQEHFSEPASTGRVAS
jgi:hypothetical protein